MSDCCDNTNPKTEEEKLCLSCGKKGKLVKEITIKSLVKEDAIARVGMTEGFYFCSEVSCDVAYYANGENKRYNRSDVKVRIGQKETVSSRQICYCFDHTVEEIENQVKETGESTVLDDIKKVMKSDRCKCEERNPQGGCCLGNVGAAIKTAKATFGKTKATQKASEPSPSINIGAVAQVGAIVSAILASACCWLPLALLAVGVSGGALSAFFETWRPVMLPVTFVLLGVAFYVSYKKPKQESSSDSCDTEGESCCPPEGTAGFTFKKMNRAMLWVVTVFVLAFALFPNYVGTIMGGAPDTLTGRQDVDKYFLKIEGMTCEACSSHIQNELKSVEGVVDAHVSYEKAEAVVGFKKGSSVPEKNKILEAVVRAGYKGSFSEKKQ